MNSSTAITDARIRLAEEAEAERDALRNRVARLEAELEHAKAEASARRNERQRKRIGRLERENRRLATLCDERADEIERLNLLYGWHSASEPPKPHERVEVRLEGAAGPTPGHHLGQGGWYALGRHWAAKRVLGWRHVAPFPTEDGR